MPNGRRRRRLTVYLTDEERAMLEARSESSGEALAKVLVDGALHPVGVVDEARAVSLTEAAEMMRDWRRQLTGVATNLNQIARHANTVSEVPADFARVVAKVECLIDEVNGLLVGVRR